MKWTDGRFHLQFMAPSQVQEGMRLAHLVHKPTGRRGILRRRAELTPVWDISLLPTVGDAHYLFRLRSGAVHSAPSGRRVLVDAEVIAGNLPPREGRWVTSEPFDRAAGVTSDGRFCARSKILEWWTAPDGRRYRLLRSCDGLLFRVCRLEGAEKWLGPPWVSLVRAGQQFDEIRSGEAW